MLVEHDDGVLTVRREDGAVAVEEVQERRQHRGEQPGHPLPWGQAGAGDELGGQRAAVRTGLQQGGQRPGPLAGLEEGTERLAPDRAEQLLVLVRGLGQFTVDGVVDGDGGDLAEQDHPALVPQERVAVTQAVDPLGHGGRGQRALGRQAPPDQRVEDRQRQLDRAALGAGDVEEGADGLLGQSQIAVRGQRDDLPARDPGGEQRDDGLVPLPGVHGQQQVVVGPVAQRRPQRVRVVEFTAVEQLGVFQAGHAPVAGQPLVHGDPGQRPGRTGLRGPACRVAGGETEPALVRDDPGVAALPALQLGVSERGQFGGGRRGGELVGVGEQGGGEFAYQVPRGVAAQAEVVPGVLEEAQRVGFGVVRAVQAGRVDLPAAVRAAPGGEPVRHGAGQGEPVAAVLLRDGGDELLVRELAEHLGQHRPAGPPPVLGVELRGQVQRRLSGWLLRHGSTPGVAGGRLRWGRCWCCHEGRRWSRRCGRAAGGRCARRRS